MFFGLIFACGVTKKRCFYVRWSKLYNNEVFSLFFRNTYAKRVFYIDIGLLEKEDKHEEAEENTSWEK